MNNIGVVPPTIRFFLKCDVCGKHSGTYTTIVQEAATNPAEGLKIAALSLNDRPFHWRLINGTDYACSTTCAGNFAETKTVRLEKALNQWMVYAETVCDGMPHERKQKEFDLAVQLSGECLARRGGK